MLPQDKVQNIKLRIVLYQNSSSCFSCQLKSGTGYFSSKKRGQVKGNTKYPTNCDPWGSARISESEFYGYVIRLCVHVRRKRQHFHSSHRFSQKKLLFSCQKICLGFLSLSEKMLQKKNCSKTARVNITQWPVSSVSVILR